MEIVDRVKALLHDYLEQNEIELVDITYRREQGGMTLRILADTPEGISMGRCEEVNNYLSELLDRDNVIDERYILEVSSPGIDRPIKTDRDFERAMGNTLEVTTSQAVDSRKTHEGALIGMDKEKVVLERDGISIVIPRNMIAVARRRPEF